MVVLAFFAACLPSTAMAATLHSYHLSGRLFAVGCETVSQCVVTGHSTHPAGTRVLVVRNGRVLRAATPRDTDYGNNTAVSCPSHRGCIAALPPAGGWGVVLAMVDSAGRITTHRVPAPAGVQFNSIACVTLSSCELAGTSVAHGAIAMATWTGEHRGRVLYANPPPPPGHSFGLGNDIPSVSCSASQCEVALNFALLDNPQRNAYQAFLVHLRHGTVDGSQWASGETVSSLSCATNRVCWAIVNPSEGPSGSQLAPIDNGTPGTPRPLDVPANALACWSLTCAVAGNDQITTFASGEQTGAHTVPAASELFAVAAGPHRVFAALGSATPAGSVLAISR
jgi:hypothetical protein